MNPVRPSEKIPEHASETLNVVIELLRLKNDAALARRLEVLPPVLSKIRHGRLPLGSSLLLRILEATGLGTRELYALVMEKTGGHVPDIETSKNIGKKNRVPHDVSTYGISRRNNKRKEMAGGYWHVKFQRAGVLFNKVFSDSTHGGMEGSLLVAQQFRDEMIRKFPPLARAKKAQTVKKTCSSGISGVRRVDRIHPHKDGPYRMIMWKAEIFLATGKKKSRTFSVKKYGEQGAFELAVEARQRFLEEMEGYVLHTPAARILQAEIEDEAAASS